MVRRVTVMAPAELGQIAPALDLSVRCRLGKAFAAKKVGANTARAAVSHVAATTGRRVAFH
jgi:hypothetical protein